MLYSPEDQEPTPLVLQPRGLLPLLNVGDDKTRTRPTPARLPPAVDNQEGLALFFQHPTCLPPILLCALGTSLVRMQLPCFLNPTVSQLAPIKPISLELPIGLPVGTV